MPHSRSPRHTGTRSSTGRRSIFSPTARWTAADIRVDARFADAIGGRTGRVVAPDPEDEQIVEATHTRVFQVPRPDGPRARLRITDPDGRMRDIPIEPTGLTIGRATDNDLVALDPRVSRHHGRITSRRGNPRLRRPRQHEWVAGERHPGHRGRPRHRRYGRGGRHRPGGRGRQDGRLMDGFLLVLWAVRILFLLLIYLFLARVIRALLRDLRAAARESGGPARGGSWCLRRPAVSRRQAIPSRSTS